MEGYMAEIRMFAADFAPKNWAYCSGQLQAISTNSALFSLLGTTYGGDGRVTFGLPDLRGRVALGVGSGAGLNPIALGEVAGSNAATLSVGNMPQHIHTFSGANIKVNGSTGGSPSPIGGTIGAVTAGNPAPYTEGFGSNQFLAQGSVAGTTDNAGGTTPLSIQNPYLGMNYIICQYGIFPSRN